MPPQIGNADYSGDVREEGGEGNFLTQQVGPFPMWVWIAAALVVVYALWVKFSGGLGSSGSTTHPLVTGQPTDTTPYNNLSAALSQILGNEQAISAGLAAQQQNNPSGSSSTDRGANQSGAVTQWPSSMRPPTNGMPNTATTQALVGRTLGSGAISWNQVVTPPSSR